MKKNYKKLSQLPAIMVLAGIWTSNQNADAPTTSGTQTVAAAGSAALNAESGKITLTGFTNAAGAIAIATITNTTVTANSRVTATINGYAGTYNTNGIPSLLEVTVTANTLVFRIINLHAANALAGTITVSFIVGQPIV